MSASFNNDDLNSASAAANSSADSAPKNISETPERDRFDLLSAYLDGEVTADERRCVEHWLATDATIKRLYARLLTLRRDMQALPIPPSTETATEATIVQVFQRLDRRPQRWVASGGMAIAALFIGAVTSILSPTLWSPTDQVAGTNPSGDRPSAELQIALDSPIIPVRNSLKRSSKSVY